MRDIANTIVAGKQTVVEPEGRGWAFHLPPAHRVTVRPDQATVSLTSPGAGGMYAVRKIREDEEEVRIVVASKPQAAHGLPGQEPGYKFPEIQEELARLKALYASLGGDLAKAEAWAPGADHDSHTSELRREIRRLRSDRGAAPSS
jgi:hypothetical protein